MRFQIVPVGNPALEELVAEPGPARLGPQPRAPRLPVGRIEAVLIHVFGLAKLALPAQSLVRSAILLWHDHLDASHQISQGIHHPDGSYLHGIMHRREPDYGNAKYWFQSVGAHPCYPTVLSAIGRSASLPASPPFLRACVAVGRWDPFAFVDACEASAHLPLGHTDVQVLEQVQEIEMRVLLNHFLES
jgi:hypothetical protein